MANFSLNKITNNLAPDLQPQLSGDYLVWQGEINGNQEIFLHDLNSQTTQQVTNNSTDDKDPDIAGNYLVWSGFKDNNYEIFQYDINSGKTTQITANDTNDLMPRISGNNLMWQGEVNTEVNVNYEGFGGTTADSDRDPGSYTGINLGNSGDNKKLASNIAAINLAHDLDISWGRASGGSNQWNASGSLSPENFDPVVDHANSKDVDIYLYLEYRSDLDGGSIYDFDWYEVGRTYAQHFGDRVGAYGIINEPDHLASGNSPEEVAFAVEQFADGVHSVNADYIVTSPGLGGTPMSIEQTDKYLEALGPLFNDGTLQVLNLHSYHDSRDKPHYSNIDNSSDFAPSRNFIRAKEVGGITNNVGFAAGEFNYRNWTGTDEDRGIGFLTTFWDQMSVVGNQGANDRVGLFSTPFTINADVAEKQISMADYYSFDENGDYVWQPNEKGQVLQTALTLSQGMDFIYTDPLDKGVSILKGGERKMWVWQNREDFSSLHDDGMVRISGIPSDATGLAVYRWDSTADQPYAMIDLNGQTSVSFNPADILPAGQTYMLMANSDNDGGNIGSIDGVEAKGADFIDQSQVTFDPNLDSAATVTSSSEIFNYNLDSGVTTQLTNNSSNDTNPNISGNRAVWLGNNGQILATDLSSDATTEIATNAVEEQSLGLDGDRLVWLGTDGNGDREIFLYDFALEATTQITDNRVNESNLQIAGNYLVWDAVGGEDGGSDREIFAYDLETNNTLQITTNSVEDDTPQVSTNQIVWSGVDENGDREIWGVSLAEVTANSGNTGGNSSVNEPPQNVDEPQELNNTNQGTNQGTNQNDLFNGTYQNDIFDGKYGDDTLIGGGGNDLLNGNQNNDLLQGNVGNDTLNGGYGNDTLVGAFGNDSLIGGGSNDLLQGNQDQDVLQGNVGNDTLMGGYGNDTLKGGYGDDILNGEQGQDLLNGGQGADSFVYFGFQDGGDVIADFQPGEDIIDLSSIIYGSSSDSSWANYLEFVPSGADTLVKVNRDGNLSQPQYTDFLTLKGVSSSELTEENFVL